MVVGIVRFDVGTFRSTIAIRLVEGSFYENGWINLALFNYFTINSYLTLNYG